ncbi:MAG: GDP-mannose 4,6-dehydratase, partial [Elusimicrobia bacterium]|nr:GDP-mannose 4,6-dehydratase [Elusimicrobiota bacterium]
MKNILVTGGCGFIGSNFIPYYLNAYPDITIVNLDKMTYAASPENLAEVENNPRYTFIKGDITDKALLEDIFKKHNISGVIHFAAESHVDNSITGPEIFVISNVLGTFTLLETARNFWQDAPFKYKDAYKTARFHHISTDEVYGSLGEKGLFSESTPYAPNSPYSASKAGSDMLVR